MVWQLIVGIFIIAVAWFSHRYAWWRPVVDWRHPRILMYHMIQVRRPKARFNGLRVTPACFESQVRWLSEHGFTFFTVSELWASWDKLPERSVAITFDDGYADNLHNALPILERYNAKATIYVVVDRHDRDWSVNKKAHHNSGELVREPKLTDTELRQLISSGRFEIGSHTLTHCNLAKTPTAEKQMEIAESKRLLAELLNTSVCSFAYPFGIYSDDDLELVRDSGYSTAVTTMEGINNLSAHPNPLSLKRIKVSGKDNLYAFVLRMRAGKRGLSK